MIHSILSRAKRAVIRCSMLPSGVRHRLFFKAFNSKQTEPFTIEAKYFSFTGNLGSFIDAYIFYFGIYEELLLKNALNHCSTKEVFLDVGANCGNHTLFFANHFKRIIAVEPNPHVFRQLEDNIQLNRLANVEPFNQALGEADDTLNMNLPLSENFGQASFVNNDFASKQLSVKVFNGEDWLNSIHAKPNFIKIDTEGFELKVLTGLKNYISLQQPVVWFENNHELYSWHSLVEAFPKNYRFYDLVNNSEIKALDDCRIENVIAVPDKI